MQLVIDTPEPVSETPKSKKRTLEDSSDPLNKTPKSSKRKQSTSTPKEASFKNEPELSSSSSIANGSYVFVSPALGQEKKEMSSTDSVSGPETISQVILRFDGSNCPKTVKGMLWNMVRPYSINQTDKSVSNEGSNDATKYYQSAKILFPEEMNYLESKYRHNFGQADSDRIDSSVKEGIESESVKSLSDSTNRSSYEGLMVDSRDNSFHPIIPSEILNNERPIPTEFEPYKNEMKEISINQRNMDMKIKDMTNFTRTMTSDISSQAGSTNGGDDLCYICKEGGKIIMCDYPSCTKGYHCFCVSSCFSSSCAAFSSIASSSMGVAPVIDEKIVWFCPSHYCVQCSCVESFPSKRSSKSSAKTMESHAVEDDNLHENLLDNVVQNLLLPRDFPVQDITCIASCKLKKCSECTMSMCETCLEGFEAQFDSQYHLFNRRGKVSSIIYNLILICH